MSDHNNVLSSTINEADQQGIRVSSGVLVGSHVCLQTVALREGLVADGAPVWFLSTVGPHVDRQVPFPSPRFPTNPTDERFSASMDLHMGSEITPAVEGLSTLGAFVRSLPSVDHHVSLQSSLR